MQVNASAFLLSESAAFYDGLAFTLCILCPVKGKGTYQTNFIVFFSILICCLVPDRKIESQKFLTYNTLTTLSFVIEAFHVCLLLLLGLFFTQIVQYR